MLSRHCFQSTSKALLQPVARRSLQRSAKSAPIGFLLDIDGVLIGSEEIMERGRAAIRLLQGRTGERGTQSYPFCLMTNGGGFDSHLRTLDLTRILDASPKISLDNFMQSHTPFRKQLQHLRKKVAYFVSSRSREGLAIAKNELEWDPEYMENVATVVNNHPPIWPFRGPTKVSRGAKRKSHLRQYGAVVVLHDSSDWGADIQIMVDILSSRDGYILDPKDPNDPSEWTRDKQIPLYWSNGDVLWKNDFPRPRMGQGSFRAAFEATFKAITGHEVYSTTIGKPTKITYDHGVHMLREFARQNGMEQPKKIYMIGDNPASDIAGANAAGLESILVRTGVYSGGEPAHKPTVIKDDVLDAVQWAIKENKM